MGGWKGVSAWWWSASGERHGLLSPCVMMVCPLSWLKDMALGQGASAASCTTTATGHAPIHVPHSWPSWEGPGRGLSCLFGHPHGSIALDTIFGGGP